MGVSDATVSKIKNEHLEQCLTLLAHLGLKIVDAGAKCMDASTFEFLTRQHVRLLQQAPELVWEDSGPADFVDTQRGGL
jgi:hypothetical protein